MCLAICWIAGNAHAQLPATRLDGVFPAGGAAGSKFDLTIAGLNLDNVNKLHFSHPGITAEVKMAEPGPFDSGPQPVVNQFVVSVAPDVPAGQYDIRAEGMYGVSNARAFEVGTLREEVEVEPNGDQKTSTPLSAPAIFNGQINSAADVDWIRFPATAGERWIISCSARRVDSRLDAILRIADSSGQTLAEARDNYANDPVIDFTAPATGDYYAVVRDALYAGGPEYSYRLQMARTPHIDFIFPPAGLAGSQQQYTIYGRNLPGGQPSSFAENGRPLEQVAATIAIPGDAVDKLQWNQRIEPHQSGVDAMEYRLAGEHGPSNPARITIATAPVVLEQEPNSSAAQAQQVTVPCEVAGQFYPLKDADWYAFSAKQGEIICIDVYSHRLGCLADPILVVQQVVKTEAGEDQVNVLAQLIDDTANRDGGHEFDTRSNDPTYRLVVPADGQYRIYLRDSFSALKSDPRLIYRLAVRHEQPDFRLVAVPAESSSSLMLRKGGRELIRVVALRQDGFDGEIRASITNLPGGLSSSEVIIGPASNVGTLVVTAEENVGPIVSALQIVGKATIGGQEVTRIARPGTASMAGQYPQPGQLMPGLPARLTRELVACVSPTEAAGATIIAGSANQVFETARGGILKIPYSVVRRNNFNGGITGMIAELPPNFNLPQVAIAGGATSGEFQINLNSATPVGTYTFVVNGFVQGYEYRRNPDAAQAAATRKTQLDQIVTETTEKARVATEMAAQAQRALDEAKNALQTAVNGKDSAARIVAEAEANLNNAMTTLKAAAEQAAAKPDDAGLAQAAAAAQQVVNDAQQKLTAAREALTAAEKLVVDSTETVKVAEQNKVTADDAAKKAADLNQLAMQTRQAAEQKAQQLANEAQPRQLNYWTPSTPVTIRIAPYPITMDGIPESVTVKQGAMVEVPLRVTRLFGFDQSVNVQANLPGGVGGIQINGVDLPNGQNENKLVIMAAPNATPGTHTLQIFTRMNFNGNGLEMQRPLKLVVEEVVTTN